MTISYVDRQGGSDSGNPLGTESSPRQSWPVQSDGMVIRLKRGSRYDMTAQYNFTAQGQIITDYGDPSLPKPILSAIHPASSASHVLYGDTIFANIHFDKYDRTGNETFESAIGQNVINHQRRGNASTPTKLVSAVYLNCSFTNLGNNAIACGYLADSEWADAAPVVMILGCDVDGIASDFFYGSVSDYLEVGHCTAKNFGTRSVSTADFIGTISCAPKFVWIHDNHVDHTSDDHKQCVMIDVVAGQFGGLAIIERNIFLGYGAITNQQAINHTVLNLEIPHILRNNYIKGSRLLYFSANVYTNPSEIHSNIFDYNGDKANGTAAVSIAAPNSAFYNNTLVSRGIGDTTVGATYLASATNSSNMRNIYVGFTQSVAYSGLRSSITGGNNAFSKTQGPFYSVNTTGADGGSSVGDIYLPESSLVDQYGTAMRPTANALLYTMGRLDKRVPDFWGRFSPEGIGYIGALMERGL